MGRVICHPIDFSPSSEAADLPNSLPVRCPQTTYYIATSSYRHKLHVTFITRYFLVQDLERRPPLASSDVAALPLPTNQHPPGFFASRPVLSLRTPPPPPPKANRVQACDSMHSRALRIKDFTAMGPMRVPEAKWKLDPVPRTIPEMRASKHANTCSSLHGRIFSCPRAPLPPPPSLAQRVIQNDLPFSSSLFSENRNGAPSSATPLSCAL